MAWFFSFFSQRLQCLLKFHGRNSGVPRRGCNVAVAEALLDEDKVAGALEQIRCERVAQAVNGNVFPDARGGKPFPERALPRAVRCE